MCCAAGQLDIGHSLAMIVGYASKHRVSDMS